MNLSEETPQITIFDIVCYVSEHAKVEANTEMRTDVWNQPAPDAIVAAMAASSGPMLSWGGNEKESRVHKWK